MSVPVMIGVALLGGAGAVLRVLVDGVVRARAGTGFPVGILVVNLSGAFALGVLAGAVASSTTERLIGTGLLGAYTTFSTWMLQSIELAHGHGRIAAAANLIGSLVVGVALAWAGTQAGALL